MKFRYSNPLITVPGTDKLLKKPPLLERDNLPENAPKNVRYFNSQQILRLLLTCEGIHGVSKYKNSTITFKKITKEVNLKECYTKNSNLNYQGLLSNGYFVLMCQKLTT